MKNTNNGGVSQPTATFEGDGSDYSSQYLNVSSIVSYTAAAHSGTKVVRMNQTNSAGPGYSKAVFTGDKVDISVWSYYESTSGYGTTNNSQANLIPLIAGIFGGVSGGTGDAGLKYNGVNTAVGQFGLGANPGDTQPSAFVNYILFDRNYKVMDMGWTRVPAGSFSKQQVTIPQVTVKEAGYIYVYLSYEDQSNNFVYFDDFQVKVTPTNILQSNEYYPFGLQTATSWTRDNATGNNFLANGGTELNTTSSLYDLEYRNYDPILGRMHQVDPMADSYSNHTPYNYSFNSPVMFNDVNGADAMGAVPRYTYNHSPGAVGDGPNGIDHGSPIYRDPNGGMTYGYGSSVDREVGMSMGFGALSYSDIAMGINAYSSANGNGSNDGIYMDDKGNTYQVINGKVYIPWAKTIGTATDNEVGLASASEAVRSKNANYSARAQSALASYASKLNSSASESSSESSPFYTAFFGTTAVTGLAVDATAREIETGAVYATKAGAKAVAKLSAGVIGLNVAVAVIQLSLSEGKPSDYARLGGSLLITASTAIPVVGTYISFGLGMADAAGANEGFYQSFDTPGVPTIYLNIGLSLPK